jgi:hypothetical protein
MEILRPKENMKRNSKMIMLRIRKFQQEEEIILTMIMKAKMKKKRKGLKTCL